MKKEPIVFIFEPRIDYLNLYCLNLQVYVHANFVIFNKFEELLTEIKKAAPDFILISLVGQDKISEKISKLNLVLKEKFVRPLVFIHAKITEKYPDITIYDSDVPVKDIVTSVAKKMGITAKYMSGIDVGEYYAIPMKYILPGWQTIQPLYTKDSSGNYFQAMAKNQIFNQEFIDKIGLENVVFCKSNLRLEIINSFTSNLKMILESEDLSVSDRFTQTEIAFEAITQAVANIGMPDTTLQLAKSSIKSMEKIIANISNVSRLYTALLEQKASYRFKHTVLASYLGQFVLKDQSWSNPNIVQQWSYLCFFHDIVLEKDEYLFFEYDEDVKKSKLQTKEKTIILNHAQMSAKLMSQVKEIPIGIDTIIKQHHGSKMGNSLSEISMSISPMCIIFILVENYIHFLLSKNESMKKSEEIYQFVDSLHKKYPYPNYKKLIPLLKTIPLKD